MTERVRVRLSDEITAAGIKLAPVGVVASWGPSDWMYALTAVYVVMQTAYLAWKWYREWKAKRG